MMRTVNGHTGCRCQLLLLLIFIIYRIWSKMGSLLVLYYKSNTLLCAAPAMEGILLPKIWTSPEEFIFTPDRFTPGREEAGARLVIGNKEAAKVKMMPFGAGRRICPGMDALVNLEYFVAKLVMAFEWHPVKGGEKADLTAEHGFFTTMQHPVRARVVPRATALATAV